jgi:hypothetical protein
VRGADARRSSPRASRRRGSLVSFNGKTFDLPLLRSRFVMARDARAAGAPAPRPPPRRPAHLPRAGGAVPLTTLERDVLGFARVGRHRRRGRARALPALPARGRVARPAARPRGRGTTRGTSPRSPRSRPSSAPALEGADAEGALRSPRPPRRRAHHLARRGPPTAPSPSPTRSREHPAVTMRLARDAHLLAAASRTAGRTIRRVAHVARLLEALALCARRRRAAPRARALLRARAG